MIYPTCVLGCLWECRVLSFGPSRNGERYSARLGPEMVNLLHHVPVGMYVASDGRLTHRPDGPLIRRRADGTVDADFAIGIVERAWVDAGGVRAVFHVVHEAADVRRMLLALERAGGLYRVGVSWTGSADRGPWRRECGGRMTRNIERILDVASIDLVSSPSVDRACVIRSLPIAVTTPKGDPVLCALTK